MNYCTGNVSDGLVADAERSNVGYKCTEKFIGSLAHTKLIQWLRDLCTIQSLELVVLELPRPYSSLKHDIQFCISTVLGLRNSIIAPHKAESRQTSEEESCTSR